MKSLAPIFVLWAIAVWATADVRPNIIFILADDLGHADIGCYGAPDAKTPNIDALAKQGIRFTTAYAMGAECTPSRTSILTGRYPQRVGGMECAIGTGNVGRYDDAITLAEQSQLGLPAEQAVLAPSLQSVGYVNVVYGKWHLGYEPQFSPLDQGFIDFTGFLGGNVEYFRHFELSDIPAYIEGRSPVERDGYLTHLITEDALTFLDQRPKDQPFFLYLPHASPHFPFQAPGDGDQPVPTQENWTDGSRETYVKMLEDLDDAVGQIVAKVDEQGITDNTVIVFASDHGAMKPGLNSPFRDYKGTLFEGGIRVPLIARWPARISAGQESDQVATLMDLTTSFLRIGGAPAAEPKLDGIDILSFAEGDRPPLARPLGWRARRGDRTWKAYRSREGWKYVEKTEGGETESWLFDLNADPGEQTDMSEVAVDQLQGLRSHLARWEETVTPSRP